MLWLWCRTAAVAPIRPLAWEPTFATGVALKRQKTKKKRERERNLRKEIVDSKSKESIENFRTKKYNI